MKKRIPLEKAALQVCIDSEKQPRIYQLTPRQGRIKLDEVQDAPVAMYPASVCTVNFDTGRWGIIRVFIVDRKIIPEIQALFFTFMEPAGYSEISIPMKSWSGNWRPEPVRSSYFRSTAYRRRLNILSP